LLTCTFSSLLGFSSRLDKQQCPACTKPCSLWASLKNDTMDNIKHIFKTHWLTILLSVGLVTTSIIIFQQKKEIKHLNYENSDLEDKVSTLENEKEELQNELDNCNSEKGDYESRSSNQSSNNWSLQNDNDNLERKIRDLEDELDDCQRKLRDCN